MAGSSGEEQTRLGCYADGEVLFAVFLVDFLIDHSLRILINLAVTFVNQRGNPYLVDQYKDQYLDCDQRIFECGILVTAERNHAAPGIR
jgi:hypothetical protein